LVVLAGKPEIGHSFDQLDTMVAMRLWLVVSLSLLSTSALAQHRGGGGGRAPTTNPTMSGTGANTGSGNGASVHGTGASTSGPINFSVDKTRNAAADGARARALAGDCKGALDLFDEALRRSIEVTLYRDRGACHEKLGDVFPAIDDYRAYLSQAPDATDAETIRARLDALVKDSSQDMAPALGKGGDFASEMRGGMTDGSTPEGKPKDPTIHGDDDSKGEKPSSVDSDKTLNTLEYEEGRDKQAEQGALRKGTGIVFGVFAWERYVASNYAFDFGQGFAVRLGYSFSSTSTLALELGYMDQLSTGSASSSGGFSGTLNYEFRIALDRWADNQLIWGFGAGYENLTSGTQQTFSNVIGRGRFGYRHVFGPALGLDIAADGGLLLTFPEDAPSGTSTFGAGAFFGGVVALAVGF
jgi:hypothetical protein